MNIKKSKQTLMGIAAILVLFFHLFPSQNGHGIISDITNYSISISYIGVDIFFFLSGYTLMFSDIDNYMKYINKKIKRIYPIFIISVIITFIMGRLGIVKSILTILNIDIFISGGASLLWFLQAIIILYILALIYKNQLEKYNNLKTFLLHIVLWFILMIFIENTLTNKSINIFLCRIPIFLMGMTLAKYEGKSIKNRGIIAFLLFALGIFISFNFGYKVKVNSPIMNIFYVYSIPLVLGIIVISDLVFSKFKFKILDFIGKITLELYCFQMIFGGLIYKIIMPYINNLYISFVVVVTILIIISFLAKNIIGFLLNKE